MGIKRSIVKTVLLSAFMLLVPLLNFAAPTADSLYKKMNLSQVGLSYVAFEKAMLGWTKLSAQNKLNKDYILAIADLSQSANAKRLYILDLEKNILLFQTYVAHGRNSGDEYAKSFSNTANSYQSSLGFYTTGSTYNGKHGLSLRLMGMEPSINDLAEERAIVIHGADYVCENFIKQNGRLGRSLGCPAVSPELCAPIIDVLKDGTCFFMYYPTKEYLEKSELCSK
ncbi:MAG: murein L,D-transpeptidase catalytic domain family protein [Bacteroidetes bacterium]|nr:murein L,D-transpeptidase catalytic domain family protein [Bacteroidota bacterium]